MACDNQPVFVLKKFPCLRFLRDLLFLNNGDLLREPVTTSRHSNDVTLFIDHIAQRLAQHENVLGQVGLFHKRVGPDLVQQLFLGHDFFTVFAQNQEDVEGFGLHGNGLAFAQEQAPVGVQPIGPKLKEVPWFVAHSRL